MAFEKTFYCTQCGTRLLQQGGPCSNCQFDLALDEPYGKTSAKGAAGIGWAQPADDSKYSRYQANQRVYIIVFTSGLILAIVAGMILSKQIALDREGFVVISVLSLLFFLIAWSAIRGTKRQGKEWSGIIIEKQGSINSNYDHGQPALVILSDEGTTFRLPMASSLEFDYYTVGDKIRHHNRPDLRFIEKFDKSQDEILFCPTCAYINDTRDNFCRACGTPLLKSK
ncbi:MAG: zinc ribbon domain-containing protein [Clostridiaceae bacterium]